MAEEEQEIEEAGGKEEKKKGISILRIAGLIFLFLIFFGGAFSVSHYQRLVRDLEYNIQLNTPSRQTDTTTETTPTASLKDEETLIVEAVLEKLGLEAEDTEISITDNNGEHAKGNIIEAGSVVGGGYFLAANTSDGWVVVYDGQANPACEDIEPYDFPMELVEECLDEEGVVVTRE